MQYTGTTTLADIVKDDFRGASVLSRYKLDFCCKGGRTLSDACESKGLNPQEVLQQLEAVCVVNDASGHNYDAWSMETLLHYIVDQHHHYVRSMAPVIAQHITKVARVHGERHPETIRVAHLFDKVREDLEEHLEKEEQILFPYIRTLIHSDGVPQDAPFASVAMPVRNMMIEHEMAGDDMEQIRILTHDFAPPADACTTYRIAYQELEAFEQDLHKHVHLENNILFPKAIKLEQQHLSE